MQIKTVLFALCFKSVLNNDGRMLLRLKNDSPGCYVPIPCAAHDLDGDIPMVRCKDALEFALLVAVSLAGLERLEADSF